MESRNGFEIDLIPKGRGTVRRWKVSPPKAVLLALGALCGIGGWVWLVLDAGSVPGRILDPEAAVLAR